MTLVVDPTGRVTTIYDEAIDLASLGRLSITRASSVEPAGDASWHADLSPVRGPRLGPFRNRSEALAAEKSWLEAHWLVPKP